MGPSGHGLLRRTILIALSHHIFNASDQPSVEPGALVPWSSASVIFLKEPKPTQGPRHCGTPMKSKERTGSSASRSQRPRNPEPVSGGEDLTQGQAPYSCLTCTSLEKDLSHSEYVTIVERPRPTGQSTANTEPSELEVNIDVHSTNHPRLTAGPFYLTPGCKIEAYVQHQPLFTHASNAQL